MVLEEHVLNAHVVNISQWNNKLAVWIVLRECINHHWDKFHVNYVKLVLIMIRKVLLPIISVFLVLQVLSQGKVLQLVLNVLLVNTQTQKCKMHVNYVLLENTTMP
jgi:hypothetical protein